VRLILIHHYRALPGGDGPSWLTVIGHATDSLWSVDLFRCESILLRSFWVMVVMDVFTRRIIGFGVAAANLDGPSRLPNVQSGDREAETAAVPLIRSRSIVSLSSLARESSGTRSR